MRVAILGFSDLEQSESIQAYRYFKAQDAKISAYVWGNPKVPEDVAVIHIEQGAVLTGLDDFDLLVRGPAIHPRQLPTHTPITSLTNIFLEHCPTQNLIGITGTKGKGTTSTLVANMLRAAGHTVFLGGNIGVPLLDDLPTMTPNDWVVLEMSNFQLIDARRSPHIATCLMLVPEHLDWHNDAAEYYAAKANIFSHQTSRDCAIYNSQNETSVTLAATSPGTKVPYSAPPGAYVEKGLVIIDGQTVCQTDEIKLLGEHNWQNVCAAVTTVWHAGMRDIAAMRSVLTTFSGLPYHLELIREFDGIQYYNDSFSTTPETASVAVQAFTQPKVMIMGGSSKKSDFTKLAQVVANNTVRATVVIGNTSHPHYATDGPTIEAALRKQGVTDIISLVKPGGASMEEIVATARSAAQPGDVVVLSAGCASFDMFANYKERGKQFTAAVQALA